MTLAERVRLAGVVGAGGAGFPTHVKLAARAGTVIANGAECEPLLHKDGAVMEHQASALVQGVRLAMEAVGANLGVIAVKSKNREAADAVEGAIAGTAGQASMAIRLQRLGDYYPAGDEVDLVHQVTGRWIPPGRIPLDIGCVVLNAETLVNVAASADGRSVTHKCVTIAGAVAQPITLTVPLGTPWRECLAAAGGPTGAEVSLFVSGVMMGELTADLESPVTKTSAGVVVLPRDHALVRRRSIPSEAKARIGRSACDQCRYCTELCPRYLLGYPVEPHRVMRRLGFSAVGMPDGDEWAGQCCACGLCTLYACPEDLFPKEACDDARQALRQQGWKPAGPAPTRPHPLQEGRRVPVTRLIRKLGLHAYDRPAPWHAPRLRPDRVVLALKQHAGVPAVPVVRTGDTVVGGQVVAEVPAGSLGARLHASMAGVVTAVDARGIHIQTRS